MDGNTRSSWNGMLRLCVFLVLTMTAGGPVNAEAPRAGSTPRCPESVLRLARSRDGLTFTATGQVFLLRASAPDIIRLPNGHLLAMFDYAVGRSAAGSTDAAGRPILAVSQSRDEGQSWSVPRPVKLLGAGGRAGHGRHGGLVRMPGGLVRLYCVADVQSGEAKGDATAIVTGVTRNGLEYKLDGVLPIPPSRLADARPIVVRADKHVELYVHAMDRGGKAGEIRGGPVVRLASEDGRRFRQLAPVQMPGSGFVGDIVAIEKGFRAYLSAEDGVRSMVSEVSGHWKMEDGLRLADGRDPTVVQLKDGTFLMLYGLPLDGRSAGLPQLAFASSGRSTGDRGVESATEAGQAPPETNADPSRGLSEGAAVPEGGGKGMEGLQDDSIWEPFAPESAETAVVPGPAGSGQGAARAPGASERLNPVAGERTGNRVDRPGAVEREDNSFAEAEDVGDDPFPPKPDFPNPVDYVKWFQERFATTIPDNAYDAYAALMPPAYPPGAPPPPWWPETINDMFNGDYKGPIIPWMAADHPEWEATHQSLQWLLGAFREAALRENYVHPLILPVRQTDAPEGSEKLLFNLLLPTLSGNRRMVRATLADAWRAEDGGVPPERMLGAWETSLRSARHMEQGFSLIHHLVGIAEQAMVETNALKALQHNVFASPEQMERALTTLQQYDSYDTKNPSWLPGEYAWAMDAAQYVLAPREPGGEPEVRADRAAHIYHIIGSVSGAPSDMADGLARVTPEAVKQAVEAHDGYCRALDQYWKVGYPIVRAKDLDALAERWSSVNDITKVVVPSLARAYVTATRNETSRRATQLTYAVHLFKARTGRWPASLDELPAEHGETIKIDPFTGGNFGYRLDATGPTIYSLSENGRDDGGIHSPKWNDGVQNETDSDDYVFWPPQER
jgi:hypothetical protein